MKQWKTLLCTACLVGAVTGVGYGQTMQTVAGAATVPNDIKVVSASTTSLKTNLKDAFAEAASSMKKPNANVQIIQNTLDQMGVTYDVYQLNGADKTGQKDAAIFALDVKSLATLVPEKDKTNPIYTMVMATLDQGAIDPVMEQLMFSTVNSQLPTGTRTFDLTPSYKSRADEASLPKYGALGADLTNDVSITVEDVKPLTKLTGTKYNTYTMGTRALYNQGGLQTPLYAQAAFVMNPQHPTLYLAVATDAQHTYFEPILNNLFKSIK